MPSTCTISRHGRPTLATANGPINFRNSSGPSEKRSSWSLCHVKRCACRRSSSVIGSLSGGAFVCVSPSWVAASAVGRAGVASAGGGSPCIAPCGSGWLAREQRGIARAGAHRLLRGRRTVRRRRALRRIHRLLALREGEGAALGATCSCAVAAGTATTGFAAIALARGAAASGDHQHAMTAVGKIDPRTGAGREHAQCCAKAAQPLHARCAVGIEFGAELHDLAAVRIGGSEDLAASARVGDAEHARAGRLAHRSARRRPARATPAGCSSQVPRAADRRACQFNSVLFV